MKSFQRDLERIYDSWGKALFTYALAVTGCRDLAEDALQEAFTRLLRMERAPDNLKAYAFQCVRNAAIDLVRKNQNTVPLPEDYIFNSSDNPRTQAEKREFQARVAEALKTLSEDERETIVQRLYADLTFEEIAGMRQKPLGTVASWYRRGIEKLKELLEE
jgi:RNA polymerase sigma-70 factor (ECF subfamily)